MAEVCVNADEWNALSEEDRSAVYEALQQGFPDCQISPDSGTPEAADAGPLEKPLYEGVASEAATEAEGSMNAAKTSSDTERAACEADCWNGYELALGACSRLQGKNRLIAMAAATVLYLGCIGICKARF